MAIVTRYFSTSSAGAADGTSWANRAALLSAGAFSTIIRGFNFASDTLIARIGPGTYNVTTGLASFTSTAPSQTFPCILEGALSDGSRWIPPNPAWVSAMPAWDASDANYPMPVLATTTDIQTINHGSVIVYGLKFTASGRNAEVIYGSRYLRWLQVYNNTSHISAQAVGGGTQGNENCVFACTGTSYAKVCTSVPSILQNVRMEGNSSASSGTRYGWTTGNNAGYRLSHCTVINNPGAGIIHTWNGTGSQLYVFNSVIANNGGDGISTPSTNTSLSEIKNCMITGTHTNGINMSGTHDALVVNCRIRDYSSAAIASTLPWNDAPGMGNNIDAGTDAAEYVNAAAGDYRIKYGSAFWGKGLGVADQPSSGGSYIFGG